MQSETKEQSKEELICAICQTTLGEDQPKRKLDNCVHIFHTGCIDKWIELRNLCHSVISKPTTVNQ